MNINVYTTNEIDIGDCRFMRPVKDENNLLRSWVFYKTHKGFIIQTPKITAKNIKTEDSCVDIYINRNKEKHRNFYHIFTHIEDSAINQISNNSVEWFTQHMSTDRVGSIFKSSLHAPLEIDNPFILRINKNPKLVVPENSHLICLIKIDGVIFGRNSSRLDAKLLQIKVVQNDDKIHNSFEEPEDISVDNFYNDIKSQAPTSFKNEVKNDILQEEMIEMESIKSLDKEVVKIPEQEVSLIQDNETESIISQFHEAPSAPQALEEQVPVVSEMSNDNETVITEKTYATESTVQLPKQDVKTLKMELMRAIMDNDYDSIYSLSEQLRQSNIG